MATATPSSRPTADNAFAPSSATDASAVPMRTTLSTLVGLGMAGGGFRMIPTGHPSGGPRQVSLKLTPLGGATEDKPVSFDLWDIQHHTEPSGVTAADPRVSCRKLGTLTATTGGTLAATNLRLCDGLTFTPTAHLLKLQAALGFQTQCHPGDADSEGYLILPDVGFSAAIGVDCICGTNATVCDIEYEMLSNA